MHNDYQLGSLATIFNGYSFRQSGLVKSEGEIAVIQMKDVGESTYIVKDVQEFTSVTRISERHFLQSGDLLLYSKGQRTSAVGFESKYSKTVASAAFFVIRPDSKLTDSSYLHWYLNQSVAQNWIERGRERSATVMAIPISILQTLPITLPSIDQQRIIGTFAQLVAQEHYLSLQIAEKRLAKRNQELEHLIKRSSSYYE